MGREQIKEAEDLMQTGKKISVVIPTYNRENTIGRAIKSVLCQTYDNLEVIVVDDGSTDHTEDVVEAMDDSRIKFHKLLKNGGAGYARNEGVKIASTELVAFHDSDDVWRPEKLERQMAYWREHPDYSMIYCAYLSHKLNGTLVQMPPAGMHDELEGYLFGFLLLRNTIGAPTMLFKKQCFLECGGFDASLRCLEDWEFALRFAKKNLVGYVDEILVDVIRTEGSVSSGAGNYFEARCKMIAMYHNELTDAGIFDRVVSELLKLAEEGGILNQVKNILLIMMQRYSAS